MKLLSITFTPHANIEINREKVDLLCLCAKTHYDSECQRSVQQGGILFAMQNVLEFIKPPTWSVGHDEIDLMLKILESGETHPQTDKAQVWDLAHELRTLARELENHTPERILFPKEPQPKKKP